jgi:UDP-N-acetylglucosamine--N-acetylmuramyl-(pentapeptide) pyrophosphoryl-undecaprenol N-acetylglucosamine transferase
MLDNRLSANDCRVMIMAGGTGGHVFPALAVADKLRASNSNLCWLGTRRGIESDLVPAHGIELHYLTVEGLRGRGLLALLRAPFKLLRSVLQACKIINQFKPSVALGMGGFASGPGALAALLKGVPLVIHEQNSVAGTTNRILARLATKVMQGFPNTLNGGEWCGNPVRADIEALASPQDRFVDRSGPVKLLILGGSRGALAINKLIPQALAMIDIEHRPTVRHQVGAQHIQLTEDIYLQQGHDIESEQIEIVPFIDNMATAYEWADFVICRAGALTVAELTAAGLGALFIPFPYAIDDHQTANARLLVDCDAAKIIQESELTPAMLATQILAMVQNKNQRLEMAMQARSLAKNGSADRVAQVCLEVANG